MENYPVLEIVDQLKKELAASPLVLLQAPPGAGKSTVLPLKLINEAWLGEKKIIMLEPRRIAARSVADRLADLSGQDTGDLVGYRIRFETKVSSKTKIEVVTEGILTRMIQSDNSLEDVGLIIFDEFHERSLHADLALALTLQMQSILRPDLKVLIMSATIDTAVLGAKLNAPVVTSAGKQFPVSLKYASKDSNDSPVNKTAQAIRSALAEEEGDILVFLPGSGEIKRVQQLLESQDSLQAVVYPLYGDLPFKKQREAILPRNDGQRKVVLATAIAETSLTIEGISVVIDSGLARVPRFDPRTGLTTLQTIRVTKDAADQRAGRAGRLGPGVCFRLWTEGVQRNLIDQRKPEILEADLAPMMLELFQWGIRDVSELFWITTPPPGPVAQAVELLRNLEAIDDNGITRRGKEMLRLPTHPRLAHMLLHAQDRNGTRMLALATDIAAVLEERDPLDRDAGADITLRLHALRQWRSNERVAAEYSVLERIERLASNWRRILKVDQDNSLPQEGHAGESLWAAYPERLAQQQGKLSPRYKLMNGRMATLSQHDALVREQWLCAAQVDAGVSEGKIFLAAAIDPKDLVSHAIERKVVKWDDERNAVVSQVERRVGILLLDAKPSPVQDGDEYKKVIFEKVRELGLRILGDGEKRTEIQNRVLSLRSWRPEEEWPDFSEEGLLTNLEVWLDPFLNGVTKLVDLERLDIFQILYAGIPWELQPKLNQLAPEKIAVPSGSMIRLHYAADGSSPVLEVRLQEMFGLADTPTVNDGRVPVKLHLLSPGYKPVQVTQDLRSFWHTTYHEVRKELRMRYPKHHWPEDPWTAEAVRGAKRRNA